MRSENLPVAALLAATFIWGSTFALVKAALADTDPLSFLGLRFAVAFGSTALAVMVIPRRFMFRRLSFGDVMMGGLTGATLYGGFFFQTQGLRFTTAANSAFITGLCVIMVPFLIWVSGKTPRRTHVAGACLSLFGLYWLTGGGLALTGRGDLLTLLCALMFALHIICLGVFGRRVESFRLFAVQLFFAALLAMLIGFGWGGPVRWSGNLIVALVVTGVLATSVAFFFQTWAQRRMAPSRASIWILTEPLFALGFGLLLLGEIPPPIGLLGAAFMLLGVAVAERGGKIPLMTRLFGRAAGDFFKR
ncbi:MAG: DMT family transporter [bacterium]